MPERSRKWASSRFDGLGSKRRISVLTCQLVLQFPLGDALLLWLPQEVPVKIIFALTLVSLFLPAFAPELPDAPRAGCHFSAACGTDRSLAGARR